MLSYTKKPLVGTWTHYSPTPMRIPLASPVYIPPSPCPECRARTGCVDSRVQVLLKEGQLHGVSYSCSSIQAITLELPKDLRLESTCQLSRNSGPHQIPLNRFLVPCIFTNSVAYSRYVYKRQLFPWICAGNIHIAKI